MSKSASPKISIVTPVHNNIEHTLTFLKSVNKIKYDNFETIIIDDGSTDGTSEKLKETHPEVIVLKGDGNLWWSGSTNLGVQYALSNGTDYIFTINNDVELDANIFASLVKTTEAKPKSVIGCIIFYMNDHDRVWYFGGDLSDKIADIEMYKGKAADFTKLTETGVLTGMGVFIPAEVFKEIGDYDAKNFPQYFADSDFSLRAKAAGYTLYVDPTAKVYSDVGSSWIRAKLKKPTPGFIYQLFFKDRSPHSIKIRYKFYKRYWPKQTIRMMFRFYWILASKIVRPESN